MGQVMAAGEKPPWTEHPKVQTWRERHHAVDVAVETADGFRRHRTSRAAALLSHYGFLSVFPLMLVFTTVVGFVLQNRPDLQADVIDSALASLPIIGQQLGIDPAGLRGSGLALAVGITVALWAGLKAFVYAQQAMDDAWDVPLTARMNPVKVRARALGMAAIIGGAQVVAAFGASLVGLAGVAAVHRALLVLGGIALNTAVVGLSYKVLTTRVLDWRTEVLPGAVPAGILLSGLQVLGTVVVARAIGNAAPVYGTFATVIALLSWMSLHALVALGGIELNAALHRVRSRVARSGA